MKKAYLLVYSETLGTRDKVKQWLNEMQQIITWRYDIPNSFYLVSEATAREISDALHDRASKGRFIITELAENVSGWLPAETWYLLNHKERKATGATK